MRTHNYPMPALTAQGRPNPAINAVRDTRKYVCVSLTPIPYYRYPSEDALLNSATPEESGLKRGEWVTASQHNDKWLCIDSGRWIPLYVNGIRVLEPVKDIKQKFVVVPSATQAGKSPTHNSQINTNLTNSADSNRADPASYATSSSGPQSYQQTNAALARRAAFRVTKTQLQAAISTSLSPR